MRPEAALELVGKYARLQRRINLIKTERPGATHAPGLATNEHDAYAEMLRQAKAECDDDYTKRGIFASGWIGAERFYGLTASILHHHRSRNDRLLYTSHPTCTKAGESVHELAKGWL